MKQQKIIRKLLYEFENDGIKRIASWIDCISGDGPRIFWGMSARYDNVRETDDWNKILRWSSEVEKANDQYFFWR